MNNKIIAIALLSSAFFATPAALAQQPYGQSSTILAPVRIPCVPDRISFADTSYDLNRIDLYERLDRELTAISYTHGSTLLLIKRANRYFPEIIPILRSNGVPTDFVYLACIESSLNPRAYSSAKAAGIWQFTPSTAKQYGLEVNNDVDERYNIEKATEAACRYLKNAKSRYGNWESAAAAYNAGPARITKELDAQVASSALDLYLVEETSRYVFRLLATKMIMENPRAYGFQISADQLYTPMEYSTVDVSDPVEDWPTWAKEKGLTYYQLRDANPWILSKKLPNTSGKTYKVRIPTKESLYRSTADRTVYNPNWITN